MREKQPSKIALNYWEELGGAIAKLVLDAAVYTPLLGAGLDAEAAVAAFRARTEQ